MKEMRPQQLSELVAFLEDLARRRAATVTYGDIAHRFQLPELTDVWSTHPLAPVFDNLDEPPWVLRRLQPLRGWSHEDDSNTLLPGAARARGADGAGAPGRSRIAVGSDCLDSRQGGLYARVAAPVGAPGRA